MKRGFTQHYFSSKKNGFKKASPSTTFSTRKSSAGFTLIELLVVVAIIGLLAGVILASLDGVKLKSRDAKRLSDIGEIRNGLNLYFTDNNIFPIFPSGVTIIGTDALSVILTTTRAMSSVPADPISPTYDYVYTSNNSGTDFTISFCLEGTSIQGYSQGCGNTVTP